MFNEILNLNGKNKVLCFYPNVTTSEKKHEVKKYNSTEINNIQIALNKYKNIKKIKLEQTESFYRDLIHVHLKYLTTNINDGCCEENYYVKRNNDAVIMGNDLLITTLIKQLDDEQYPKLSKYDYTCTKNIDVFNVENIDVLFVSFNNQTSVYLDLSRVKKSDEKLFNELQNIIKK